MPPSQRVPVVVLVPSDNERPLPNRSCVAEHTKMKVQWQPCGITVSSLTESRRARASGAEGQRSNRNKAELGSDVTATRTCTCSQAISGNGPCRQWIGREDAACPHNRGCLKRTPTHDCPKPAWDTGDEKDHGGMSKVRSEIVTMPHGKTIERYRSQFQVPTRGETA